MRLAENSAFYVRRAEESKRSAADAPDEDARRILSEIADRYLLMAEHARKAESASEAS